MKNVAAPRLFFILTSSFLIMARSRSLTRNLLAATVAVVAGNALYFLVLWPHLPPQARHEVYQLDLGLLVDFWVCAACFGVLKLIFAFKKRS